MLLRKYDLKIVLSDCNPSSLKVNAIADLSEDISEVLPYLNTVLKGLQYYTEEKILTAKRGGRLITFRPRQIALTKLEDEKEATVVMEELKRIVNETYENRGHIEPTYASRSIPRPLDILNSFRVQIVRNVGNRPVWPLPLSLWDRTRKLQDVIHCFPKNIREKGTC